MAFYLIEGSAQDPEPTEWDSDEMITSKLQRLSSFKLGAGGS